MRGTSLGGAPLRVAVAGTGAFGRNHLRVYRELQAAGAQVDRAGWRWWMLIRALLRLQVRSSAWAVVVTEVEECLADLRLDAASVCVPTVHHAAVAELLLTAGVDLLIEKPLAGSLADADRILAAAQKYGRVVQVIGASGAVSIRRADGGGARYPEPADVL